jgi:hypothetical protein
LILGPRRLALIAAIAAVALAIIFYPVIVSDPIDVDKVLIDLTSVAVDDSASSDQELVLRLTLSMTNNNTMTLTTSKIDYTLFADGEMVAEETLSYEDIPVNGRPALFPESRVPLSESFILEYTDDNSEIFNRILHNSTQMDWSMRGSAIIESGTTQVTKEFQTELEK